MKRKLINPIGRAGGCLLVAVVSCHGAGAIEGWQQQQQLEVRAPGLIKMSLPGTTLDRARPGLEDLRLVDAEANEVPFLIERPRPAMRRAPAAKSFAATLEESITVLTLETGITNPVAAVTLVSPGESFLKGVQVQGSSNGSHWTTLASGLPIFKQANGATQLAVSFPPGAWPWLRLRIDDRRSPPVPFTGATVHTADATQPPVEPVRVTLADRHENPGVTRLTLKLAAANLDLAGIRIQTSDPLFTRHVSLAVPRVTESGVREETVAHGVLFRTSAEAEPVVAELRLPVEATIPGHEVVLLVHNLDSPPLAIESVKAERYPVYLIFHARTGGSYRLLTGNPLAAAPRYDVVSLAAGLQKTPVTALNISPVEPNPAFRRPDAIPGVQEGGTDIDLAGWRYRKMLRLDRAGAQQLELDLDILARAQSGLADLRIVRSGRQIPFILDRTSIERSLAPEAAPVNTPKQPDLSRWSLGFTHPNLPLSSILFDTTTPLFQREMGMYEERQDSRGDTHRVHLAGANWTRTPESRPTFRMALDGSPRQAILYLETRNGDNPPIQLTEFRAHYRATRLLFKSAGTNDYFLYYGNRDAAAPRYDLSLVAHQLAVAEKTVVTAAPEEQLQKPSWAEGHRPGKGGVVFWGILGLVVVSLLVIITRLVPREQ